MTPEKLGKGPVDETMRQRVHAIAQEAYRRRSEQTHPGHPIDAPTVMMAIEIALSDWTPPKPVVDRDVLAFREWVKSHHRPSILEPDVDAGMYDGDPVAAAFLAGARMAREQERERAKALVELAEGLTTLDSDDNIPAIAAVARFTLAKYRGEA